MKKAFTLIELISVIIIIGVVALISTPIVTSIIDNSKEKAYEETIANIENAAYYYSVSNELGYKQSYESIELETLQVKGYMENDKIIDPRNSTQMEGCVFYRWLLDSKQYEFIYDDDCNLDDIYPELTVNILNENKLWLQEKLKFEIDSKYDSYKYCVGKNECEIDNEYKGTTTIAKDGKNMYVCAVGYFGDQAGKSTCVGPYNVDTVSPEITSNKVTYTSSKIIVNATCNDATSLVKEIKYSINGGEYQESNLFTNLKTGEYKVKTNCIDNALNESEVEATVKLEMSAPTIVQVSQTPSSGTWAQKRVIRITYNSTNIENPRYYYSLDGSTWTEVTSTTKDIEFTSNGYLYAKTVDNAGNTASAAAFTVVNVDSTKPSVSIAVSNVKTDRATITATCSDNESKIAKYEFSKDNGATWVNNGTTSSYTFTGLTQGTSYTYKVRCTNGSGLTNEASSSESTSSITKPTIAQVSQTPSSGTYAQKRVIRITYSGANVESPKYYYSLDGSTWTEVTSTTKDIEFTSNGYLYAKTTDPKGNVAAAATFTVTNIDTSKPSTSIAVSNVKTDRATVTATCADSESSIAKYEFSKDNGSTWVNNGTTSSYTFTGLTQGTSYTYKVRCTNGSGLTNEASSEESTASIAAPTIAQVSQTPSSGTYAQSRVIKITYTATNIQTPEYYFKSSVAATVASGVVTHACGTSTNPGTCSASSVTTLAANTWYKTSSTTPSITYTQNGYLYAQTWDPADNTAAASTFTITNVDTVAPTVNVAVSETTATITLSDNMQLAGYAVNTSSTAVSSWTSVTGTSASESWTATEAGTYYAWVKDASGRTEKYEFKIEESAFCPYEIGQTFEFAYTGDIQEFIAQCDGEYKLEVWGAQGGGTNGGKGGYSTGVIKLTKNDNLYIIVGGNGSCATNGGSALGGYNGGGASKSRGSGYTMCSGGGASHMAITNRGVLSNYKDYNSDILLVAGGGGGAGSGSNNSSGGGDGGGVKGLIASNSCSDCGTRTGGSQTAGGTGRAGTGSFGQGHGSTTNACCGGGGGLYGGAGDTYEWGASGGSGYVGNIMDVQTIAGNDSIPTYDGTNTMTGNTGNGYAKIIYLGKEKEKWEFTYTETIQEFIVPKTGTYKLETWGAQGGSAGGAGGNGGYSSGSVKLEEGTILYVGVGGAGIAPVISNENAGTSINVTGGYNGGGNSSGYYPKSGKAYAGASGGGATHIGTFNSTLAAHGSTSGLYIVAGGGGGGGKIHGWYGDDWNWKVENMNGGAGGGISGINGAGTTYGTGGTQTTPGICYNISGYNSIIGKFGIGGFGDGVEESVGIWGGGGGGGLYGGGAGWGGSGGGGGSSYIDGLTDGQTIAGNLSMPTHDGIGTMTGNTGDGYARITLISAD